MYRPNLKEEEEINEMCTFHPVVGGSGRVGAAKLEQTSAEKENAKGMMNRRRSTEEFLRDQQAYEDKRRVKREML